MADQRLLMHLLHHYNGEGRLALKKRLVNELERTPQFLYHLHQLDKCIKQAHQRLRLPLLRTSGMLKRPPTNSVSKPKPIRMRIPNIMAGQVFSETISIHDAINGELHISHVHVDDSFEGCEFGNEPLTISGKASKAGDYNVSLSCFLYSSTGEQRPVIGLLKVTVIADPQSLWKNLPADETARFHKPDSNSLRLSNDSIQLLGASVRGRAHAHHGIHRDDDFTLLMADNADQWNVLCVADGAGSCQYSRRGAQIASHKASSVLRETLNSHYGEKLPVYYKALAQEDTPENQQRLQQVYQQTMVKAVYSAAMKIQEEVDQNPGDSFKDYSTTLLLVAHKPLADGHLVFGFWVGDGGAVIYQHNEQVILLGKPDGGQFAGQTRFLDKKMFEDGSVYNRVFLTKVSSMTALILATDGITDPWFDSERQMSEVEKWDTLWSSISPFIQEPDTDAACEGITEWLSFWSPGHHDDRSIAICSVNS